MYDVEDRNSLEEGTAYVRETLVYLTVELVFVLVSYLLWL